MIIKQNAFKQLFEMSKWSKKRWCEDLDISYTQLRKWLSDESINIHPDNIAKAAYLMGFGIAWENSDKMKLRLLKTNSAYQVENIPIQQGNTEKNIITYKKVIYKYLNSADVAEKSSYRVLLNQSIIDPASGGVSGYFGAHTPLPLDQEPHNKIEITVTDNAMIPALKPGYKVTAEQNINVNDGNLILLVDNFGNKYIGEMFKGNNRIILFRYGANNLSFEKEEYTHIYKIINIELP